MLQAIIGFHLDDAHDWVAELACGHSQHVRHRPPWQNRPWVVMEAGRNAHLGHRLNCKECDREVENGQKTGKKKCPQ